MYRKIIIIKRCKGLKERKKDCCIFPVFSVLFLIRWVYRIIKQPSNTQYGGEQVLFMLLTGDILGFGFPPPP